MQSHTGRLARHMLSYVGAAASCRTMAELQKCAESTIALAGMSVIASGMVTGPRASLDIPFHFHNWPAGWLKLYRERGYMERDPLPRWAIVSGAAARWSDILGQLPSSDPGHEIVAALSPFNLRDGVVTPVRSVEGHLGLVSVGGAGGPASEQEFAFLQSVCTATLHRAEALASATPPRPIPTLSPREIECLTLLTQGMTEREIAARLGIREVTARFHLDNARTKTGARSRTHLAGIAAQWFGRRGRP